MLANKLQQFFQLRTVIVSIYLVMKSKFEIYKTLSLAFLQNERPIFCFNSFILKRTEDSNLRHLPTLCWNKWLTTRPYDNDTNRDRLSIFFKYVCTFTSYIAANPNGALVLARDEIEGCNPVFWLCAVLAQFVVCNATPIRKQHIFCFIFLTIYIRELIYFASMYIRILIHIVTYIYTISLWVALSWWLVIKTVWYCKSRKRQSLFDWLAKPQLRLRLNIV